ncbi:hypothetical protein RHMOL_Rhmol12G0068100 [Rhododendron molle]|uniref:Uncharacterized protein n=4 Tax=Rhododendron molle TaxID=49168 RepID=A0ACC0LGE6_RHOML|nr:hypothetical protein RHMOL_Rhmol12G0068100 [Rhododendron molle]KAI8527346.1 hypothetical protein RHMOL_Rhmol12G0068100 [Rhododendron molle]KAI8527348.1 hypothetical protein RHMOL_Rhmol12G0068100 [Rhododendron molle]KAI8527349.1 hypothetical protein RHMOL_Rhmol12G0068100 [Rhododendron molle]
MNDDLIRRLSLFLLSLEHLQQTGDISGEVNVESRCAQNWFPAASPDPRHLLPSLRLLATGSEDNYMSVNIHSKCAPIFFAFYVFDKMYERQMNDDEDAFDVLYCIAFALMDAQWLVMPAKTCGERERKRGRSFWANNPTSPPPQLTPNDARSLLSFFTHDQLLSVVQSIALCHPNVFSAFGTSGHLRPDRISSLRNPRPLEAANEMKIDL